MVIELGLKLENPVKAFFIKDEGKNLIFKCSFDATSSISMVYQAICSTVNSPFSLENHVSDLRDFPSPRHLNLLDIIRKGRHKEWLVSKIDVEPYPTEDLLDSPSDYLILMPPTLL